MTARNKKIHPVRSRGSLRALATSNGTRFISALLIISILLPTALLSTPKTARAAVPVGVPVADVPAEMTGLLSKISHYIATPSTVTNTGLHIKDFAAFLLRQALMHAAKAVLARITQATINWINSDFHGSPLFIENPASFFKDIAKSEVRNLVDMIGYDTFRFPFGPQTALNVIASYRSQLATNAQYTLSKVINDPRLLVRYRNDFNYGGWNGFLINTQYPQNNYLGFQGIIQQNLASRLEGTLVAPAQKIQNALQQGMGFLSPQTCPSNPKYNNGVNEFLKPSYKSLPYDVPSPEYDYVTDPPTIKNQATIDQATERWRTNNTANRATWAEKNDCPGGLVNTTPGSVVANHIMDAMGSNLRQTELGAALGNSLSAIFDALLSHFLDKGLNALASTVNPAPSNDNWSYQGQNLGEGGNPIVDSRALIVPTNVSVRVGQTVSIALAGGTGNYRKKDNSGPDPTKATVEIFTKISAGGASSSILSVTGVPPKNPLDKSKRTTEFVVEDTTTTSGIKPVTVNVSVYAIGALAIMNENCPGILIKDKNNSCILADTNTPFPTTIEGGTGPYGISTYPDQGIAVVSLDPDEGNLIISGVNRGKTFVIIKDSANAFRTIEINIASIEDLSIPQDISVAVDQTTNVPISGGTDPYFIETVFNESVATAKIVPAVPATRTTPAILAQLSITGRSTPGSSGVIIKDSSTPIKSASATINTTAKTTTTTSSTPADTTPVGTCYIPTSEFDGKTAYIIQREKVTKEKCKSDSGTVWGDVNGNNRVAI